MSLNRIPEMQQLLSWLGRLQRSPLQTHALNESDSEVIRLGPDQYLAITTDGISEEILVGLYRDPYTMGWVTAMASLSDLAATGASPLGLLWATHWGADFSIEKKSQVAQGFSDALTRCGAFLLGGDSGSSRSTVLTATAVGISSAPPLSRKGLKPGHILCLTGKSGAGPSLAHRFLNGEGPEFFPEEYFRPVARIEEGKKLLGLASACMDTSDGVVSTVKTLMELNQVCVELMWNPETLDSRAIEYSRRNDLPLFLNWIGEHGDFELLLGVPEESYTMAKELVPSLQRIGTVTSEAFAESDPSIDVRCLDGTRIHLDLDDFLGHSNEPFSELRRWVFRMIQKIRDVGLP